MFHIEAIRLSISVHGGMFLHAAEAQSVPGDKKMAAKHILGVVSHWFFVRKERANFRA